MEPTNGIMNKIVEWGNANGNKIEQAYSFNGGWEGWVQVELAMVMKQTFESENRGATITVTREDPVYGTAQRSDLLITTRRPGNNFTNMFELKCEASRAGGAAAFAAAVGADCTKVNNAAIANQYLPCKAWVVAFSATRDLTNLAVGGANLKAYPKKITAGAMTITLYWGSKDFK
ncbi:hypothetical protein AAF712_005193 [Marasmius tenuissimus]|uniref:Uncharacterized protein n=1 Tax=Marasmius tenuissimus TaxID=585030 RepID=A0ABR3A294_9AGAR